MIYQQPKEISGEILRMAIPTMAKHDAAYHPMTYTVWYEYLAGLNPALKDDINTLVSRGDKVTDTQIEAFYNKHIRKRDDRLEQQTEAEFRRLVADLCELAQRTGGDVGQYREVLDSCARRLDGEPDHTALNAVMRVLITETQSMQQSMAKLESDLQDRDRQVETLRQTVNAVQDQALTDPLTGLYNRRGFTQALDTLAPQTDDPQRGDISLIMADIDHFKKINDTHGHLMGDKVIRTVAQMVKADVQGITAVARLGGEEFALLCTGMTLSETRELAEQIRGKVSEARLRRTDTQQDVGPVTISLGVAMHVPFESMESFMHRADMALYSAKNGGRNRVAVAQEQG